MRKSLFLGSVCVLVLPQAANRAMGSVTFNFTYLDPAGSGFNHATLGGARKAALESVANNVIGAQLNYTQSVNITVNASTTGQGYLATAGSGLNYALPSDGFVDFNLAYKIKTGIDRNGASADGTMTWNFDVDYQLGPGDPGDDQYDFRSVALHELSHALGFASNINSTGHGFNGSGGNPAYGELFETYDQFLENTASAKLIDPSTKKFNTSASLSDLTTAVFFNGPNARAANVGNRVQLATPTPFSSGTSLSHLNDDNDVMASGIGNSDTRRYWTAADYGIFKDLGYSMIVNMPSLDWDSNGGVAGLGGSGSWTTDSGTLPQNARFWTPNAGANFNGWINGTKAHFAGSPGFVDIASTVIASTLIFDVNGYVIRSGSANGTLGLIAPIDGASSTPTIQVTTGDLTATINASIYGTAGLTKTGAGRLTLNGTNTYTGPTTVSAGTLALGRTNLFTSLTVAASSTVIVNLGGDKVLSTRSLVVDPTGRIDLNDNDMIVEYAPGFSQLTTVKNLITSGYANGAWTGNGIDSKSAASNSSTHRTALGYAEASAIGITSTGIFSGQPVDSTSILIRYTLLGDANIDGTVDINDFTRLSTNFNQPSAIWTQGDFNYDGFANALDFNAIASNFGQVLGSALPDLAVLVPEPMAVGVMLLGITLMKRHRTRREFW